MKTMRILFISLFIFAGTLVFAKNMIVKSAIVNGVKAIAGVEVGMAGVDVGLIKSFLSLKGLEILNPRGFSDKVMADFPEIYVGYDLAAFLNGKVHLTELKIYLKELTVIKDKDNQVNIKSLETFAPKGGGKAAPIQIDNLYLKIDKVIYKDYSSGSPSVREFNVNIDQYYKNITDPKALGSLIVVKALSKTTVASLANIDLSDMKQQVSQVFDQGAQGVLQQIEKKASTTLHGIFGGSK